MWYVVNIILTEESVELHVLVQKLNIWNVQQLTSGNWGISRFKFVRLAFIFSWQIDVESLIEHVLIITSLYNNNNNFIRPDWTKTSFVTVQLNSFRCHFVKPVFFLIIFLWIFITPGKTGYSVFTHRLEFVLYRCFGIHLQSVKCSIYLHFLCQLISMFYTILISFVLIIYIQWS